MTTALPPVPAEFHAVARDGEAVLIRPATAADEPELQRFFSSVTMDADLQLSVHRAPSLLRMYQIQAVEWETWIGLIGDEVVGMGTMLSGSGYIAGEPVRLGYLGDLRLDPRVRGRSTLGALYGPVLSGFAARCNVDVFLTAVIASNSRAIEGLTSPKAREYGVPEYHLLNRFDIRAVHLLQPRRAARSSDISVCRASESDIAALAEFLDADARSRPFGEAMTAERLTQRVAEWPGLQIEDFRIATRGGSSQIVGCMAPWDASGIKQTVVQAYRGPMRRAKLGYNLVAGALRSAKLPHPGDQLHYLYATHNAILDDDPHVQHALLNSVYRDLRRSGNVFLSCFAPENDPLSSAYSGYVCNNLKAHLYAVVPHGNPLPHSLTSGGRPRFEMALV